MAGNWAIVTGAGNGIGAVIARLAVRDGYRVAAWDTDADGLAGLAARLGDRCATRVVDVSDEAAVDAAAAALDPAPALLVNNAGMVRFGALMDLPLSDWRGVLDVNLTGTFVVARAVARMMIRAGRGAIVNIASVNGVAPSVGAGAYTASKAGVVRLTGQMALEWGEHGVRVNAVAPGLIDAGISDAVNADPQVRRIREAGVPLNRLGTAEEIAEVVLFLGSERASYLTGQTISVDGGVTQTALSGIPRSGPGNSG